MKTIDEVTESIGRVLGVAAELGAGRRGGRTAGRLHVR